MKDFFLLVRVTVFTTMFSEYERLRFTENRHTRLFYSGEHHVLVNSQLQFS